MSLQIDRTSFVSPNHNSRGTAVVNLFVLHATVGDALSSLRHLCNPAPINPRTRKPDPALAVSIQYLITRLGKIYQLVDEDEAAWHAGAARWRDMVSAQIRNGSIGIELENRNDGKDPYPQVQLDALTWLVRDLLTRYPLPLDHIVSHAEIAIPAGRKTDPKGFDWEAFYTSVVRGTPMPIPMPQAPPKPPPVSLPPTPPTTKLYKVKSVMISQRPECGAPYAGELQPGEEVVVDKWYAAYHSVHLQDARGFVLLEDLEAI